MRVRSFLPIYKTGIDEIQNGCIIKLPEFCNRRTEKCEKFYKEIFNEEQGIKICPYGFNTYINTTEEGKDIFTGLRIKGEFDSKKVNPKIYSKEESKIITFEEMIEYIKFYNENLKLKNENEYLKESMNNIIHDVKEYNSNIKNKCEILSKRENYKKRNYDKLTSKVKGIWAMSQLISTRLKSYDYLYSGFPYNNGSKIEFNFYNNFEKIRRCFLDEAKQSNKDIKVRSKYRCTEVYMYDSVEYMPFLIIENALKYSKSNSLIDVEIVDKNEMQIITIKSEGILVKNNEIEKLFERGYRGKLAREHKQKGNGIGLYLVKQICEANDIEVRIESEKNNCKNNKGVDLGFFKVILCIKK